MGPQVFQQLAEGMTRLSTNTDNMQKELSKVVKGQKDIMVGQEVIGECGWMLLASFQALPCLSVSELQMIVTTYLMGFCIISMQWTH